MMKTLYWTFTTLVVGLTLAISPARAQQNINCTTQLTSGTFNNVSVPRNATCILNTPVKVEGNVSVAAGATLDTESIDGSILANGAALIFIDSSSIDKNINAAGTTRVEVFGSLVDGNITVSGASFIAITGGNSVGGNVNDSMNNTGAGNTNIISGNLIGGNLVCAGNTPPPTNNGSANTVSGNEVGQCAGL